MVPLDEIIRQVRLELNPDEAGYRTKEGGDLIFAGRGRRAG